MPTPIGHTLSGILLLSYFRISIKQMGLILMVIFFALLPDIDLAFGYVAGNPNLYHHMATHSLLFVVAAGIGGGLLWGWFQPAEKKWAVILFTGAGVLHLLLDMLSVDTSVPYGMPLFWPFWSDYYIAPVAVFSDVYRSSDSRDFFVSLYNRHNLYAILLEIGILSPILLVMFWLRRKSK